MNDISRDWERFEPGISRMTTEEKKERMMKERKGE
jgi:hypothetical protein